MARTKANSHIYGDLASGVWVAPKGTTLPTTLAAPPAGFNEVGWLSDDGIEWSRDEDTKSFNAYQGATLIRKKTTKVEDKLKFTALEENAVVFGLMLKGQTGSTAAGVTTFNVTNQAKSDERTWVIDVVDDTVQKRYCIPSGTASLSGSVKHSNDDLVGYEFELAIIGDYTILTSAPS